jgi:hypothetical protein
MPFWRAEAENRRLECGADSFVIRRGLIIMQTIFYQLVEES